MTHHLSRVHFWKAPQTLMLCLIMLVQAGCTLAPDYERPKAPDLWWQRMEPAASARLANFRGPAHR